VKKLAFPLLLILSVFISCGTQESTDDLSNKLSVIFDTDANNELDDQYALAYLFSNQDYFDIRAITVNATRNGGDIQGHYDEAERIMQLFKVNNEIPLLKGANKSFEEIKDSLRNANYDGFEAVDFIMGHGIILGIKE
jgi:purine nucleosidase